MRASLQAVYGIRLATVRQNYGALELADLVAYLPDGCALWLEVGGSRAWTPESHLLNMVEFRLRVLDWRKTKDAKSGINKPELHKPPPIAGDRDVAEAKTSARAAAWEERQKRKEA